MKIKFKIIFVSLLGVFFTFCAVRAEDVSLERNLDKTDCFRFTVTADMRNNHKLFRSVCSVINNIMDGPGVFHISVGDINPPRRNREIINGEFGEDAVWYPVVGNHELDDASGADMDWIRNEFKSLPYIVNEGPQGCEETTYSFDYKNAHFIILNEYYDGISDTGADGNIVTGLFTWLKEDLDDNIKPFVFVFGHEPAFPVPDDHWNNGRHYGDSLDKYPDKRDAFWDLLEENNVAAYICGHAHRYSRYQHDNGGVWQVVAVTCPPPVNNHKYDALLDISVFDNEVSFEVYRDLDQDGEYTLYDSWIVPQRIRRSARVVEWGGLENR